MRDRQAYLDAGRSDPHSPEQMSEHPYDFVSLPDRPREVAAVAHGEYPAEGLNGVLRLVYQTESPLHVGSGVLESAAECGLGRSSQPVRGILRSRGRPVLPGSSFKGAVRARFEAITASRLAVVGKVAMEDAFKVPEKALRRHERKKHRFEIDDPRVAALAPQRIVRDPAALSRLSPADALFGCMGYRGRVHPGEGVISGPPATEPLRVAALDSPQAHRLATPGGMAHDSWVKYRITRVEGRKFYYDGDVVPHRAVRDRGGERQVYEYIDHVPAGASIAIEVRLRSVSEAELGALVVAAGFGPEVGIVRFGGYKSVGLGKVRLQSAAAKLHRGLDGRRWRRGGGEDFDLARAVAAAENHLLETGRLRELHQVTTMRRP